MSERVHNQEVVVVGKPQVTYLHVFPADVPVQEVALGLSCQISIASWHLSKHAGKGTCSILWAITQRAC